MAETTHAKPIIHSGPLSSHLQCVVVRCYLFNFKSILAVEHSRFGLGTHAYRHRSKLFSSLETVQVSHDTISHFPSYSAYVVKKTSTALLERIALYSYRPENGYVLRVSKISTSLSKKRSLNTYPYMIDRNLFFLNMRFWCCTPLEALSSIRPRFTASCTDSAFKTSISLIYIINTHLHQLET